MANNLYEYYSGQGKKLPTVQERQGIASEAGISNYAGTAEQNNRLLAYLQTPKQPAVATPAPAPAPAPAAPVATSPAPTGVGPTATPAGLGLTFTQDPNQSEIEKAIAASTRGYTEGVPDEAKIRQDTIASFQTEIDALDKAAAEARARVTAQYQDIGNRRVGAQRALLNDSGMLGQVSGEGEKNRLESANAQELGAAVAFENAKYEQAKQALLGQARSIASESYQAKLKAYSEGAASTVQYLREKQAMASSNAAKLARQALASGIDLTDPKNKNDVAALAKQIGVSPEDFVMAYRDLRDEQEAAAAEKERKQLLEDRTYQLDVGKFQFDQEKFSQEQQLKAQELNFNIDKFNAEYALNSAKVDAEIRKINADLSGSGDAVLDDKTAIDLGLAPGATRAQAVEAMALAKNQNTADNLSRVQETLRLIFDLKNHEGLAGATGDIGSHINWFQPKAQDAKAKFERLQALLSLDNIGKLKGTGPITDREQEILRNASSSMRLTGDKQNLITELERIENSLKGSEKELKQNLMASPNTGLDAEYEAQFGGSEGTNPKAPVSTIAPQSSKPLANTKALASAVIPKYPTGASGGQCVTFLHKIADFPSIGDGKNQKFASVDKAVKSGTGVTASQLPTSAKVGMIIITGENKTYGHGAMINAISADGKYARLTESNYKGNEKVTHERVIALDDPRIYGALIPKKIKNIA